ncbi:MAG: hypothetical protein R6U17_04220 [Thermoplasmata archaeon]
MPIEVKYKEALKDRDMKGIVSFMKGNDVDKGIVITKDHLEEVDIYWI